MLDARGRFGSVKLLVWGKAGSRVQPCAAHAFFNLLHACALLVSYLLLLKPLLVLLAAFVFLVSARHLESCYMRTARYD